MKKPVFIVTTVSLALLISSTALPSQFCGETRTTEGPVVGLAESGRSACAFKGIPYAAPPVGDLRLRAPQSPEKRDSVLEAFDFGPTCVQKEGIYSGGTSKEISEDCLYLNIWRPQKSGTFPVMFWIHGGGYTQGAGTYEMYNGARLAAERDVVVVTINYRLGALGFMALPELAEEDPNDSTGNYGLLDTITALQWVRDNIANFGGDPDNVTIFGESAGGVSVCNLLASPPAAGLFHRGIIESGGCDLVTPLDRGYESGREAVEKLGCNGPDVLECLRGKSDKDFLKASGVASAHADGYVLPDVPIELFKKGEFNKVPVMVGSNKDEWDVALLITGIYSVPNFIVRSVMKKALGPRYQEMRALYPEKEFKKEKKFLAEVFTDGFGSRAYAAAETLSPHVPVYYYRFDWDDQRYGKYLGAFHGLEIAFAFGNVTFKDSPIAIFFPKRSSDLAEPLAQTMMSFWTNFAKTGNPNGQALPQWPTYNPSDKPRLHLDNNIHTAPLTATEIERYEYFASISVEDLMKGLETD